MSELGEGAGSVTWLSHWTSPTDDAGLLVNWCGSGRCALAASGLAGGAVLVAVALGVDGVDARLHRGTAVPGAHLLVGGSRRLGHAVLVDVVHRRAVREARRAGGLRGLGRADRDHRGYGRQRGGTDAMDLVHSCSRDVVLDVSGMPGARIGVVSIKCGTLAGPESGNWRGWLRSPGFDTFRRQGAFPAQPTGCFGVVGGGHRSWTDGCCAGRRLRLPVAAA